jgi:hypothetical protein
MLEPPLPADSAPRRGRWYRVRLTADLSMELEYAATKRHLPPETLLTTINQVILREHLIDAVLDDQDDPT